MPTTITPVPTQVLTAFSAPADLDADSAASVNAGFQALANAASWAVLNAIALGGANAQTTANLLRISNGGSGVQCGLLASFNLGGGGPPVARLYMRNDGGFIITTNAFVNSSGQWQADSNVQLATGCYIGCVPGGSTNVEGGFVVVSVAAGSVSGGGTAGRWYDNNTTLSGTSVGWLNTEIYASTTTSQLVDPVVGGSLSMTGGVAQVSGIGISWQTVATAGLSYTVLNSATLVGQNAVGAGAVVNLPTSPVNGQIEIVKDQVGTAGTNNVTVRAAVNIDGTAGATGIKITTNYGVLRFYYNSSQWWTW